MTSHINGSQMPTRKGPRVPVVRVTSTEPQQFTIVSKSIFGQDIHWFRGRSHECTKETKKCNGCERGWSEKWKGYLDCVLWHTTQGERCFLELTPRACEMLLQLAEKDRPLRGLVIRVSKTKGGAKGRYLISALERRIDERELPQEEDPLPVLRKLWLSKDQYVHDEKNVV